jgi:hypothetical protein
LINWSFEIPFEKIEPILTLLCPNMIGVIIITTMSEKECSTCEEEEEEDDYEGQISMFTGNTFGELLEWATKNDSIRKEESKRRQEEINGAEKEIKRREQLIKENEEMIKYRTSLRADIERQIVLNQELIKEKQELLKQNALQIEKYASMSLDDMLKKRKLERRLDRIA